MSVAPAVSPARSSRSRWVLGFGVVAAGVALGLVSFSLLSPAPAPSNLAAPAPLPLADAAPPPSLPATVVVRTNGSGTGIISRRSDGEDPVGPIGPGGAELPRPASGTATYWVRVDGYLPAQVILRPDSAASQTVLLQPESGTLERAAPEPGASPDAPQAQGSRHHRDGHGAHGSQRRPRGSFPATLLPQTPSHACDAAEPLRRPRPRRPRPRSARVAAATCTTPGRAEPPVGQPYSARAAQRARASDPRSTSCGKARVGLGRGSTRSAVRESPPTSTSWVAGAARAGPRATKLVHAAEVVRDGAQGRSHEDQPRQGEAASRRGRAPRR
ncbi:MAG: hypothetical protein R3A52_00460 [Polyangiales bacterium]